MKAAAAFLLLLSLALPLASAQPNPPMNDSTNKTALATFGGGCYWCTEAIYQMIPGVKSVASGFAGGTKENPTYEEVCTGTNDGINCALITGFGFVERPPVTMATAMATTTRSPQVMPLTLWILFFPSL